MYQRLLRSVILGIVVSLLTAGCILSKSVERSFIGYTQGPKYKNHKVTGFILLPIAVAADIVTFPVQAVLLMIFGDNFPFEQNRYTTVLNNDPQFQTLNDEQKSVARAELGILLRSGAVSTNHGLFLCEDGHWVVVDLNPGIRTELIARADRTP